jgi:hypothetical protein
MNDDPARTHEFGTGLRTRLERIEHSRVRAPLPSNRDLVDLLEELPVEPSTPELVLVAGDLSRAGAPVPAAA